LLIEYGLCAFLPLIGLLAAFPAESRRNVSRAVVERSACGILWRIRETALGKLQRRYLDPVSGQAGLFRTIEEGSTSVIVTVRIRVDNRKIAVAEWLVARKGDPAGATPATRMGDDDGPVVRGDAVEVAVGRGGPDALADCTSNLETITSPRAATRWWMKKPASAESMNAKPPSVVERSTQTRTGGPS